MQFLDFEITPEAVAFARSFMDEDSVLTISPQTQAIAIDADDDDIDRVIAIGMRHVPAAESLASQLKWSVGACPRSRFPAEDVLVIGGLPVFVPEEMKEVLSGRKVALIANELKIVPEPPLPGVSK
jgi:hypothetical protein